MAARIRTLRQTVTLLAALLIGLASIATTSVLVVTGAMHEAAVTLDSCVENVARAKGAQIDLLELEHNHDAGERAALAKDLRTKLFDAKRFVDSADEEAALAVASERVETYLAEPGRADLAEAAGHAMATLARVNMDEARASRLRANHLDRAAEIGGTAGALLVVASSLAMASWLRRRTRALVSLAETMKRYGDGQESARAPVDGPTELREMPRRFNELADRLGEQKKRHQTLLAGVAHDLRNPLAALRIATDVVSEEDAALPPEPKLRRILTIVRRQLDRLERLVSDLLDTENLQAGRLMLSIANHDLRDIARTVAELFASASPSHRVVLTVPEEAAIVPCDAPRVEQVLGNLVGNAIKYSPSGARVTISVATQGDDVTVAVADEGLGMSEEEIEAVFDPFVRLDSGRARAAGYGLGLFVARRLVEEHGGTIHVTSAPGRGSTFRVVLPRAAKAAAALPPVPATSPSLH